MESHAWRGPLRAAPRTLTTLDQLAERFPEWVTSHELGYDHDWGEFPFQTLRNGVAASRTARAEPPFRQRVVSLRGSSCVGRHGTILGPDGGLVAEFGYFVPDDDPRFRKPLSQFNPLFLRARWLSDLRYRRQIPAPQKLPGTALVLNNPWCHNFYHWMLEVAPRLMLVRQAGLHVDWYIVDCQSGYQRRALELLGARSEQIIQPHCRLHLAPDELLRPSHPGLAAWRQMAETMVGAIESTTVGQVQREPMPKRLYISRRGADHRKVADEVQLELWLKQQGFESRGFEQIDLSEQIQLIRHAELIVTVHGAALANLIFARAGTRVVEICPEGRYNMDCFPRMSHKLGHQHLCVITPSTRYRQNLSVNRDDLAQALAQCGLRQEEGRSSHCPKVA